MKASIVTNNRRTPGGLFVLHARSLPDNPYDGHTLRDVIDRTEALTGCPIERAYVDKGYCGHDTQNRRRVLFLSGQKPGVFGAIKRELRRRSTIEPIIRHLKAEGHLGRCYLKGRAGDGGRATFTMLLFAPALLEARLNNELGLSMAKKTKKIARRLYSAADVKELRAHSKARTPVVKIVKQMKRSEGSLRQKALTLGIPLGHVR